MIPPTVPQALNSGPDVQLNLNVRGLTPSATVAINEHCDRLLAEGKTVFKMGLGQSPFPVPEPVVEELRKHAGEKQYLPVRGLPELRRAVAEHHRGAFGFEVSEQNILVGPGSKELMFLLQLVYYGDIVIPTPSWVSYAPQAQIIGRHIGWIQTSRDDGWRLLPDRLDALCRLDPGRPRIVVLNYPCNPTGATYDQAELEELAAVARQYRLILLSDEIYGKLRHQGEHRSIVPLYPEGTIFSGGLSKWCGAGGWRLGVFVFPENLRWLQDAMEAVASETFTSTSAPIQYAAVRAFQGGPEIERYLDASRRILGALGSRLADKLATAGARIVQPKGAFYLFPDFGGFSEKLQSRGITTSTQLTAKLLADTGVAVLPGRVFGRHETELTVRISYVNFDGRRALEAALDGPEAPPVDDDFLAEYCGETLEAVDRICNWLDT